MVVLFYSKRYLGLLASPIRSDSSSSTLLFFSRLLCTAVNGLDSLFDCVDDSNIDQPISPDLQGDSTESNRVSQKDSKEEHNNEGTEPFAIAIAVDLEDNPPNLQKNQDTNVPSPRQIIHRIYHNKLLLLGIFCIWMGLKSAWEKASRPTFETDSRDPLQILRRVKTSYSAVVGDENFKGAQRAAPSLNFADLASKLRQGEEIVHRVAIAKNMTNAASQRRMMERMMTPVPWLIPKEAGNKVVNHIWDDMVFI
jgi:hypothetical protein